VKATTSAELIEEMAPHVARFVAAKLRQLPYITRQDIEDISQDALLRVSQAKTPCDPQRSEPEIKAWFWLAARSAIGRHFGAKRRKKRIPWAAPLEDASGILRGERTPVEEDAQNDQCQVILAEVRKLSPWMRDAMLRHLGLREPLSDPRRASGDRAILSHARVELRKRLQRRGFTVAPAARASTPPPDQTPP
jgi:DNA-directed RNA polymerase specialized sigma24 family protein